MKHAKILACATGALIMMFPVERSSGQCATITETQKITAPTPTQNDFFGTSVSLSGDDAVIGAKEDLNRSGSAYLYGRNVGGTDNWGMVAQLVPAKKQVSV